MVKKGRKKKKLIKYFRKHLFLIKIELLLIKFF
jgi:hypothetical protein